MRIFRAYKAALRIRMFLGLPDPDALALGTDPVPQDPFSIKQNTKKNLDSCCFVATLKVTN